MPDAPLPTALVIFDCDGVLVDSERIAHETIAASCADLGLPLTADEATAMFIGGRWSLVVEEIERRLGRAVPDDFTTTFRARLVARLEAEVCAMPGIHELLDVLDARGVATCVASNGPQEKMRATLGRTGLLPRLAGRIHSAYDIDDFKPAPGLFLHAARAMDVAPAACLVVEDSMNGVRAAAAADMRCAALVPAGERPDFADAGAVLIRALSEVPGLLA